MHQRMLMTILLAFPLAAQADALVLNDVKAQNGTQLSVDELKQLMPSAKVVSHTEAGGTRYWTNETDGKLLASSDSSRKAGRVTNSKTAQGTWHVGNDGTYCVAIEWRGKSEDWCRYFFKVGAKYYGVGSVTNGAAKAQEFEFSK